MNTLCVIPARYASTRLPGKPLADIAGKPMISRVFDRASKAKLVTGVIAAVDDERVYEAVVKNGGTAMMTRKHHATVWQRWQRLIQRQSLLLMYRVTSHLLTRKLLMH